MMQRIKQLLIVALVFVFAAIGFSACGNAECGSEPATLTKISVTTKPTKVQYLRGEYFNSYGMVVTAYFSDFTMLILSKNDYRINVTNQDVNRKFNTDGISTVTVSYGTKTDTFDVVVYKTYDEMSPVELGTITKLEIGCRPICGEIEVGSSIYDYLDGLIIKEYMSSGLFVSYEYNQYSKDRYTFTGFDSSEPDEYQIITVNSAINPAAGAAIFTFSIVLPE